MFPNFRELDVKLVSEAIVAVRGAEMNDAAAAFSTGSIKFSTRSGRAKSVRVGAYVSACRAKFHEKLAAKAVSSPIYHGLLEIRGFDLSEL